MESVGNAIEFWDILDSAKPGIIPKVLLKEANPGDAGWGLVATQRAEGVYNSQVGANNERQASEDGILVNLWVVLGVRTLVGLRIVGEGSWWRHGN